MQNNQSSLQQYLLLDFNDQYKTEDIDLSEDLNDNDDCFNQSYAESNSQHQSLDNPSLD